MIASACVTADRFDYHYGFHAVCAAISWVSGVEPRRSVLWTGQLLIALTPLALLLLARLVGLGGFGALVAAAMPAACLWFPAYYLSWGRYTQLTGLLLMPAALWSLRRALEGAAWATGFARGRRSCARLRLPPWPPGCCSPITGLWSSTGWARCCSPSPFAACWRACPVACFT